MRWYRGFAGVCSGMLPRTSGRVHTSLEASVASAKYGMPNISEDLVGVDDGTRNDWRGCGLLNGRKV